MSMVEITWILSAQFFDLSSPENHNHFNAAIFTNSSPWFTSSSMNIAQTDLQTSGRITLYTSPYERRPMASIRISPYSIIAQARMMTASGVSTHTTTTSPLQRKFRQQRILEYQITDLGNECWLLRYGVIELLAMSYELSKMEVVSTCGDPQYILTGHEKNCLCCEIASSSLCVISSGSSLDWHLCKWCYRWSSIDLLSITARCWTWNLGSSIV